MQYKNFPMVPRVIFGRGSFNQIQEILAPKRVNTKAPFIFLVDDVFEHNPWLIDRIPLRFLDQIVFVSAEEEPKTSQVDALVEELKSRFTENPSGIIGIGGGIILSPVILLLHWGKMKEAAAVSALFIWVNSAAGLFGQLSSGVTLSSQSFVLVGFALLGGFFGSYLGSHKFNNKHLRQVLAFVLIIASVKLFLV